MNDLDAIVGEYFPSIAAKQRRRNERRSKAMTRLLKWEQRKLSQALDAGKYREASDFADAISDLAMRMSRK